MTPSRPITPAAVRARLSAGPVPPRVRNSPTALGGLHAHGYVPGAEGRGRALYGLGADPARLRDRAMQEEVGRHLGLENELRVVEALRTVTPRPWWVFGVRRALREEDRAGIDVVVLSRDAGPLYLQVKSSRRNVERWRAEHPELVDEVGLVVVERGDDLRAVWARAMGALVLLREARGL